LRLPLRVLDNQKPAPTDPSTRRATFSGCNETVALFDRKTNGAANNSQKHSRTVNGRTSCSLGPSTPSQLASPFIRGQLQNFWSGDGLYAIVAGSRTMTFSFCAQVEKADPMTQIELSLSSEETPMSWDWKGRLRLFTLQVRLEVSRNAAQ